MMSGRAGPPTVRGVDGVVTCDVAVVGAGPAGLAAAVAARRAGADVVLIDAYGAPGGQIWRRRYDAGVDAVARDGRHALRALAATSVRVLSGRSVWGVEAPRTLLLDGPPGRVEAGAVVLATGAFDRPVAFPGWTLPGVLTAGAAQSLAKGQGVLPGRRVLLAGAGPFLLPVARQLASQGAEVVAVAEATRRRDWLRAAPRMARHWDRLAAYAGYRARVRRIAWGQVIVRAEGDGRVESATLAACGPDWAPVAGTERTFSVDAVCTAYGFVPDVALARALGCELEGDAVAHDDAMQTSVAGVYAAGEAAGVGGAELATVEGEIAGRAAAGAPVGPSERRAKLADFARILADLFDPRPGLDRLAGPDTVICRCEDVTAAEIDAAVAGGATTPAALKIVSRCGQGPCQGRVCERLVAARLPARERFSARAPVAPVPLAALIDER
jgi:thioredoxin reductase/bacterioferritin-associated ferredoxin